MSDTTPVPMIPTVINGQWLLRLPEHRAVRPEWVTGWEKERLASMHANIGTGDVVYDIGTEEGDFPGLWSLWGAEVVMFEPNPRVWPNVKAIWDANGLRPPLATFAGFAADHDGDRDVEYLGHHPGPLWPSSSYGPVIGDHGFCNLSERPDIPRLKIDTVAEIVAPPTAITIDVEGAEFRVLLGAHNVLKRHRPLVWVSVHPQFMDDTHGDHPDNLYAYMDGLAYSRELLAVDHEHHYKFTPLS